MTDQSTEITLIALIVTIVGLGFTIFKYVQGKIDSVQKEADLKNEATRKEAELRAEKVAETESKARHSLENQFTQKLGKLEVQQIDLGRQAVRKEEMGAMEVRLTQATAKLEAKVDHLQERLNILPVLESQSKQNGERLERLLTRVDEGKQFGRNS